ncbi:MAG: hypothetical protein R3E66_11405 [bacterium]
MSQWFLIDRDGRRPVRSTHPDFFSSFDYDGGPTWPQFVQLAVDASLNHVLKAVETTAMVNGLDLEDVSTRPDAWDSALVIVRNGASLILAETDPDADYHFLHDESASQVAGLLACNAAFYGHETSSGTVFVSTWETGAIDLTWCDSLEPGPSFARVFHRNGTCTEEDPRGFALRALDMPATSPLLDRYAFVEFLLKPFGIEEMHPVIDELPVLAAFKVRG